MVNRKLKNNTSRIIEFYIKWGQKSFLFTLVCIVWLAWRVSTKPSRLNYPCSQFALWQITLYFSTISTPLIGICHRCISYIRQRNYQKIAGVVLIILVLTGTFNLYSEYIDNQLKIAGSGTIPASSSAISPRVSTTGIELGSQYVDFPHNISPDHAVVSFSHDPLIDYGGTPPYDQEFNPAYDFVWDTVARLNLGSFTNPLDDLINAGDTVLIKPNWVDYGPAVYTRPEVVRPLIDMAIAAGATEIYIGDGGVGVPSVNNVIDSAGYSAMTSNLTSLHPGITIETVNLCSHSDGWRWISLSENSSFAGSGISHADLGTGSESLYNHQYYTTSDNLGVNPGGDTLGWYAVNNRILEADVIINASKMKTHQLMMATMSIKNLVGCTISCTYNQDTMTQARIAHHPYPTPTEYNYFNNDIFWRAILDMNKIILYTDENGVFQPTQQRMYLNVVDGIQAMERSQHHSYGGGGLPYYRHVILAGVDPVAVDAIGCRIMGYDYSVIPSINNADTDIVHPVGINDPEKLVVLGDEIDSAINHVFEFNSAWNDNAVDINLGLADFTPPSIHSINRVGYSITANISDCLAAYIIYQADGTEYVEKMVKTGDMYTGSISDTANEYKILAQDEYFNTLQSIPQYIEDTTPPYTSGRAPSPGETGVPVDTNIMVHVLDDGEGVDIAAITMTIEGVPVSPDITGNSTDYTLTYDPPVDFNHLQVVDVTVNASDLAIPANAMIEDSYSFTTIHEEYTLTVNTVGSGNVTLNPPGGSYPSGTVVELTANATPGWTFSGWSGDLISTDNPETITMDGNKTITATFMQNPHDLTMAVDPGIGGTTNPVVGVHVYAEGSIVPITAIPAAGYAFVNWTGDVADPNADSTTVTIDGDKTVTANFIAEEYTLTVSIAGHGSVTKNPDKVTYDYGDIVQLTAVPDIDWDFVGWSGDLSGSTNPEMVTMDGDKMVGAKFKKGTTSGGSTGGGGVGGGGDGGTTKDSRFTSLRSYIAQDGTLLDPVEALSLDNKLQLYLPAGTVAKNRNDVFLPAIKVTTIEDAEESPEYWEMISYAYELEPIGSTFDPPITLNIKYDPSLISEGVSEDKLFIANWDESLSQWVAEDSTVNTDEDVVATQISSFSIYAVMAKTRPAEFSITDLSIVPDEVDPSESVTISITVANTGDLTGSYTAVLKVDDAVKETKEVTLGGGTSQDVSFTVTPDAGGDYTVDVNGLSGKFKVNVPEGEVAEVPAPEELAPVPPEPKPTAEEPVTPAEPEPPAKEPVTPAPEVVEAPVTEIPEETTINWGVIIGGIIAAVLVIGGLLSYFLWWQRRTA